ncbi:DUF4382 domain-containing protein [Okeania sp.]|uniref:DUF4382 domain-containing protein n=1 Tax=Okeania sp. TaxID=3100323 RepID=UPI002B4B8D13|nr:DUF4382 domain-containing protein [Okeania sp.]MEB3342733.1 DUF4382 domain-containing protein [Okeania sp.]
MRKLFTVLTLALIAPTVLLSSCQNETSQVQTNQNQTQTNEKTPGTLQIRANGEDFVRKGFVTKDGWTIAFDKLYVNLAEVTAYQTDPSYKAETGEKPEATEKVIVTETKTIDLAEGNETAETILVSQISAPPGHYNAISWKMPKAIDGPVKDYSLLMTGTGTKNGQTIPFTIKIDQELEFTCGDFIGDERKGILLPGETAELEATFHFDHLFGDNSVAPDEEINTGALGFAPLVAIATAGKVDVDMAQLKNQLSPADYQKFMGILPSLGHVGEGHCHESVIK